MDDLAACPMCGQALPDDAAVERLCRTCRMAIEPASIHFALAGAAGLGFYCSPTCLRAYLALASAHTGGVAAAGS